jgi:hypothetical protein
LKPDEQAYALRSNEDVEMYDVEDDEVEEEAVLDELDGKGAHNTVSLHITKVVPLAEDSEEEDEEARGGRR